jgi:glycosyltransferase involved in cell wall biosynthesis
MTSQKKPVVMQILPSLESGGVERGTIDIAKALKNDAFEPIVLSKGGVLVYQLREAGITHITLPIHSKNPVVIFLNIKRLVRIIQKHHVDIIHVRSRAPMWSAYFACKKTGTKLVATVHGTYSLKFWKWKVFPLKRTYNELMLKADQIIVVSSFIKGYLAENYPFDVSKKTTTINRGADLNYFNSHKVSMNRMIDLSKKWNLPEDKKIILMPARFTAWKGHEFLIDALAKVRGDFFCAMVGSDHGHKKFRQKIEKKIVDSNLSGKVRVVGMCKDMPAAYATSHFVVFPSVRPEAFGRIAIEAQACQKVVIATKIGGALDTIIDGKTGFLVEPFDVSEFTRLIEKALEMTKEEADKIGNAGRKNIEENFSNEKMCSETLAVYKKLLA